MTIEEKIRALEETRARLQEGGGKDRIAKQHKAGKLSCRERIEMLVDGGSFEESFLFARHRCTNFGLDQKEFPGDGVVTGCARIEGRPVHIASQDFTVAGGAAGETHCDKIVEMMQGSARTGSPFVFINDSGGARVQEGIESLAAYGRVFFHNVSLSGVVPQISLILGPCAGGAAYSPALTDFIIQSRKAHMFITGPAVIKQVTGETIDQEQLGGADAHMAKAGTIHFIAEDDAHALGICRTLLGFLPSNNREDPPRLAWHEAIEPDLRFRSAVPEESKQAYDVRDVIRLTADGGDLLEVQQDFARNIVVGLIRVAGRSVGVIANQPKVLAGSLDIDASDKAAHFIRFCNAFNIPLLTFVDIPGFMPGVRQEHGGIIRHGAKMLFAYASATVPKITVVLRKAYGGAFLAMCNRDIGADRVYAWPGAEIAVMGAEGAAEIIFRRDIEAAEDQAAKRKELQQMYRNVFANPEVAASRRQVDDLIDPADTRVRIASALELLTQHREFRPAKKHGLTPL